MVQNQSQRKSKPLKTPAHQSRKTLSEASWAWCQSLFLDILPWLHHCGSWPTTTSSNGYQACVSQISEKISDAKNYLTCTKFIHKNFSFARLYEKWTAICGKVARKLLFGPESSSRALRNAHTIRERSIWEASEAKAPWPTSTHSHRQWYVSKKTPQWCRELRALLLKNNWTTRADMIPCESHIRRKWSGHYNHE